MPRKEKRNKLEIYYNIISAVKKESKKGGIVKTTRIQQLSNLSYDKYSRYLEELNNKKMIVSNSPIALTKKGQKFLQDYDKIDQFLKKMKLRYIGNDDRLG